VVSVDVYKNYSSLFASRASDFGLMKIDDTGRVVSFSEKPKGDDLKAMVS
jgi:ADP-glucose pyrophosphorylase